MRLFHATCAIFALAGPAIAAPGILFAGGGWAAIDRGASCEAMARSVLIAPKGRTQATAGFAFTPDRRRWGEFHAHLSRPPRAGSSVMLDIAGQPFLLVTRGDWAWSRGPRQEQAIIAAARNAPAMRIEARDGSGRRFVDTYALGGAPTAIDAAAAACAGKMQPR
ncbi:MAG TPA: hypothetical protein VJP82_07160 [Sphingomicrobium sp.]|nr:hypothetical protein [Sphingomicrobium sp.]